MSLLPSVEHHWCFGLDHFTGGLPGPRNVHRSTLLTLVRVFVAVVLAPASPVGRLWVPRVVVATCLPKIVVLLGLVQLALVLLQSQLFVSYWPVVVECQHQMPGWQQLCQIVRAAVPVLELSIAGLASPVQRPGVVWAVCGVGHMSRGAAVLKSVLNLVLALMGPVLAVLEWMLAVLAVAWPRTRP